MLDTQRKYCVGCFRTVEEITVWTKLTFKEKERIIEECKTREVKHASKNRN